MLNKASIVTILSTEFSENWQSSSKTMLLIFQRLLKPPQKTAHEPENVPVWFLKSINLDHLKLFVSFVYNY